MPVRNATLSLVPTPSAELTSTGLRIPAELERGAEGPDIGEDAARERAAREFLDGGDGAVGFVDIDARVAVAKGFLGWQISIIRIGSPASQEGPAAHLMLEFSFRRVRFHFTALDALALPVGKAANIIRGAFGLALHETAPEEEYARLFHPRASGGPSGLADPPRPFVFRCSHLEGFAAQSGEAFWLDVHFFDSANPGIERFEAAFAEWRRLGLGVGRARVQLDRAEASPVSVLPLERDAASVDGVVVRFLTATELKANGAVTNRPDFPVLFARVRDRVATLRAIYGAGPIEIDFAGMGERASAIRMTGFEIEWEPRT